MKEKMKIMQVRSLPNFSEGGYSVQSSTDDTNDCHDENQNGFARI